MSNAIHGPSNVGEPCDACHHTNVAPVAAGGCETCGNANTVGYGGYDGQVIDSYDSTPVSTTYVSPSYPANARPMESVNPRPAGR
jgi:hypothetical protein